MTATHHKESAAYRVSAGDGALALYLKEIGRYKTLPIEEEAKLAIRIRNGDASALDALIRSNLRFVVSVSRNYQNQGLPLIDLINEGNIGLIRAAKRFDEKKNFKFISYAVWWVRQSILQALAEQSRIVKLPVNRVSAIHKIGMAQSKLEQKLSREPNIGEIADELRLDSYEVLEAIKIGGSHFSLDAPLQSGEDSKLMDLIPDNQGEKPDDSSMEVSLHKEVDMMLEHLEPEEREVIKRYFGIGEETAFTLEEIGKRGVSIDGVRKKKLTRERVRQIKENALKKLKKNSRKPKFSQLRMHYGG